MLLHFFLIGPLLTNVFAEINAASLLNTLDLINHTIQGLISVRETLHSLVTDNNCEALIIALNNTQFLIDFTI